MNQAEHYDQTYASGPYAKQYARLPAYAVAMNQWSVDLIIALLGLRPEDGPVLDLGSGQGYMLDAWEARGFKTTGREISKVAIASSGRSNIDHGDATDLSGYADDEFQLVFSSAFLEHVTDERVDALVRESMRISRSAAHYIAHEQGDDPGHINVKLPYEWEAFFKDKVPVSCVIGNPLVFASPVFLHLRQMPAHIEHTARCYLFADASERRRLTDGLQKGFRWKAEAEAQEVNRQEA